ncbi:MAG: hypothetical protein L6R39_000351 [Caloplaca ligustica]|nr:MAG: hypothetical protein L6R39_000351 [Caloplaca ligustica]
MRRTLQGVGTVLGPIIGGAFTSSSAGWRWAFYINLCVAAACAPVYLFKIPSIQPRPDTPLLKRAAEIDLGGTILLTGLYLSGLMAISFGGVLYAWGSGQIVATFVVAGVLALIFLAQQIWSIGTLPERRAFPLQFFKNGTLTTVFLLECCASTLTYIPIYFVPLYFQFAKQDSAITAGVRLLPLVVFLVTAIVVNGFAVTATGKWLPWFFAGAALALIGSALLYTVDLTTSNAKLYGYTILTGAGSGCFLQLPFSVVQSLVPPETIPKAIGFVTFAQLSAPAIVLSVVNAVFLNEAGNSIASSIPTIPRDTINSILSGVGSTEFTQLDSTAQLQVVESIVAGLSKGYIVSITSGGLALVLSMWLLFVSKRAKSQAQTGP